MVRSISLWIAIAILAWFLSSLTFTYGSQGGTEGLGVVLAWLPGEDDWIKQTMDGALDLTYLMTKQLAAEDSFDFVTLPSGWGGSFLQRVEDLLTLAVESPTLAIHENRIVVLVLSGRYYGDLDASSQARKLALLTNIGSTYTRDGIRLYGVMTSAGPHASFFVELATACDPLHRTENPHWFLATKPLSLADAYARILLQARGRSVPPMVSPTKLSAIRIGVALGIILLTLAGMAWLTRTLLPPEYRVRLRIWRMFPFRPQSKQTHSATPEETPVAPS